MVWKQIELLAINESGFFFFLAYIKLDKFSEDGNV